MSPDCERDAIERELTPPFTIARPVVLSAPIVFCSPHSGSVYPNAFVAASQLDTASLRKSEDCYVDELFASAPAYGAALIAARFPRAYLDVNREPYELDPELIEGPLPDYANARTMRVIGGLGTIARVVSEADEIYRERLPLASALMRIDRLYKPFHAALERLLDEVVETFGYCVLVDCHSMPSGEPAAVAKGRADFVIGDRFGSSCDPWLTTHVRNNLSRSGHRVYLNRPYAGGFITEHYGQPFQNRHALQIEIKRGLYMNERSYERAVGFENVRRLVGQLIESLVHESKRHFGPRQAAE